MTRTSPVGRDHRVARDGDADAPAPRPRVTAAAFWTAVVLPVAYVPLLLVGPVGGERALLVAALLAMNAIALVVGHPHGRDGADA